MAGQLFQAVTIGDASLKLPLALGTMMWGSTALDAKLAGRRGVLTDEQVRTLMAAAQRKGATLWDTAIGYGGGTCEERIGRVSRPFHALGAPGCAETEPLSPSSRPLIMTKFLPTLWKWCACQFRSDLDAAIRRLGPAAPGGTVDVMFLHTPTHPRSVEFWAQQLARAKREGKCRAIGLSNCNAEQIRRAVAAIAPERIDVVQCHYSLLVGASNQLQRMVAVCRDNGITIIGFSPVGQGLLVDDLDDARFRGNRIAKVTGMKREALEPLREELKHIAERRKVPMAQVAVNWVACKGVVPLVGVRCVEHVHDAVAALSWRLSAEEEARLDRVALDRSTFEKPRWKRALALFFLSSLMIAYKIEALLYRLGCVRRAAL